MAETPGDARDQHVPGRKLCAPDTEVFWDDCLVVDRNSSVEREATIAVSLSLNGRAVAASQEGFAGFGKGNSRLILACPTG